MPEQLLLPPEAEQDPSVINTVGEFAVGEVLDQAVHQVRVGDFLVTTNLPDQAINFADEKKTDGPALGIKPSELDRLPVGSYWTEVSRPTIEYKSDLHSVPNNRTARQDFSIEETPDGRVFETDDHNGINWSEIRFTHVVKLMESLGYKIAHPAKGSVYIEAFPTPETVKARAEELGVNVEFVPDMAKIKGKKYLSIFAAGKYPVSTKAQDDYLHDIHDDHLTAMVLGGDLLRETLRSVAKDALDGKNQDPDNPKKEIDDMANYIDNYTGMLRSVVSCLLREDTPTKDYKETQMEAYESAALLARIPLSQAYKILDAATARAKDFGMVEWSYSY